MLTKYIRQVLSGLGLSYWLQRMYNAGFTHLPSNILRVGLLRLMGAEIGENTWIMPGSRFLSAKLLHIGPNSHIGPECFLDARGGLTIGTNVVIGIQSMILTADHDLNDRNFSGRLLPVVIADRVWLAARVTVASGAEIQTGAVGASGAVIVNPVDPWTIVAGVPAAPIGMRSADQTYTIRSGPNTEI